MKERNQSSLVWHCLACPKFFKIISQEYIQKTDNFSLISLLSLISNFSYDLIIFCRSLTASVSQFFDGEVDCFFLIFCDEVTSLLTSKSWLLYCCRNFSLFVFGQKKVFAIDFLGNSLKGELLSCLTFHPSFLVEQSSRSWVVVKDQLSNDQILWFLKV